MRPISYDGLPLVAAPVRMTADRLPRATLRLPRRRLLLQTVALLAAPALGSSRAAAAKLPLRTLAFRHTHTGEALSFDYSPGASLVGASWQRVVWFLRDFRTGEAHAIDPGLLDQLYALTLTTRTQAAFEVISGYRSPATNEMLRKHGGGVAVHSLHLEGRAIDIRLAGTRLEQLRDAAASLRAGGVGFYPESQFVHIDTGRVRRW